MRPFSPDGPLEGASPQEVTLANQFPRAWIDTLKPYLAFTWVAGVCGSVIADIPDAPVIVEKQVGIYPWSAFDDIWH